MWFQNRYRKITRREKRSDNRSDNLETSCNTGGLSLHGILKDNLHQIRRELGNSPDAGK
ncbi:hypothetical protein N0U24_08855 [Peribacillus frigoritolerans]|uniref:hypothetical protein n=1 Tax=Peribacillus frigoritolerans TaxID=450367 RepID=UPI0021AADBF3|nr:hypothetical protein [Peribacillus frigoritolerans]MCT4477266.1 hypothetical protein [Peribacillus frigoritolerans]